MMLPPFEEFAKIDVLGQRCFITEKIHGSNAQVWIMEVIGEQPADWEPFIVEVDGLEYLVLAGSRTRWLTLDDDNFGFAAFVRDNAEAFARLLGEGRHYGEWYGSGIGSGYGLSEKRLALFNARRWSGPAQGGKLPPRVDVIPVLYRGPFSEKEVQAALDKLRAEGSQLSSARGFPRPEGVVVYFESSDVSMKRPFKNEECAWTQGARPHTPKGTVDRAAIDATCAPFWQPVRLEKLLLRDERFTREWPSHLADLVSAYVKDLFEETPGVPEDTMRLVRKEAFRAVKAMAEHAITP